MAAVASEMVSTHRDFLLGRKAHGFERVVLGLLIGAILVKVSSWRWIFWFIAIVALPIAVLSAVLIPGGLTTVPDSPETPKPSLLRKINSLDLGGITLLTGMSRSHMFSIIFVD